MTPVPNDKRLSHLLHYEPARKGRSRKALSRGAYWSTQPIGEWLQLFAIEHFSDEELNTATQARYTNLERVFSDLRAWLLRAQCCPGVHAPTGKRRRYRVTIKHPEEVRAKLRSYPDFESALDARLEHEMTKCRATEQRHRKLAESPPQRPENTPKRKGVYWTKTGKFAVYDPHDLDQRGRPRYYGSYKHYDDAVRVRKALIAYRDIPEDLIENRYPGLRYDPDRRHWVITHDGATVGTAPTFTVAKRIKQDLERR
jgi:hypothetical protein